MLVSSLFIVLILALSLCQLYGVPAVLGADFVFIFCLGGEECFDELHEQSLSPDALHSMS